MTRESIVLATELPVEPEALFAAWLDSRAHAAFTGAPAQIDPQVGGVYTAWDGYIQGRTVALEGSRKIVQAWRTSEFADSDADSVVELVLKPGGLGTRIVLRHTEIPAGQGQKYAEGWQDFYFTPMAAYFGKAGGGKKGAGKKVPAKKKAPAKKTAPAANKAPAKAPAKKTAPAAKKAPAKKAPTAKKAPGRK